MAGLAVLLGCSAPADAPPGARLVQKGMDWWSDSGSRGGGGGGSYGSGGANPLAALGWAICFVTPCVGVVLLPYVVVRVVMILRRRRERGAVRLVAPPPDDGPGDR